MKFHPAWWCPGPHLQTLVPWLIRRRGTVVFRRERLELADGDFLDLDWHETRDADPLAVLLHGLEGSSRSHYIPGLVKALAQRRIASVVMHFRGCSGEPNRLSRRYHAGDTADLAAVLEHLRSQMPQRRLVAIGFSLGANALLKYLGEASSAHPLGGAVAVSTPFRLDAAADRLQHGASRLYQWALLRELRKRTREKFRHVAPPFPVPDLDQIGSIRLFDDVITAPMHGFTSGQAYYAQSSSRQHLRYITIPTLLIHARNDPLMAPKVVPATNELAPLTELELHPSGGHVGFVAGSWPWRPRYWLDERIPAWLTSKLDPPG